MISNEKFILLSHWNGRFGNRMHQYAYGVTYSKLHRVPFLLPSDWEGTHLFKTQHHSVIDNDDVRLKINQTMRELDTVDYRYSSMKEHYPAIKRIHPEMADQNYFSYDHPVYFDSVCAYSSTIFSPMSREHLINVFEFSDQVKSTWAYRYWKARQNTYDIAHLRRDDISNPDYNKHNTQGYSVISKKSYYAAFEKYDIDPDTIQWISDDYTNKWHEDRRPSPRFGWSYPAGSEYREDFVFDWLEDFLKLYFARTIFRANSSFSWWASFLSPTAKIYSPVVNKKHIYGVDGMEEIDVNFVEGNQPHWMYNQPDIIIN
jgi:hypothetical protein